MEVKLEKRRGKGSHKILYYGKHRVIIKDLNKEIGTGLLKAILDELGIDRNELLQHILFIQVITMFNFNYPVRVRKDRSGRYLVTFPDIPFAVTDGATREAALEEAVDCLEEALAELIVNGEKVPVPSPIKSGMTMVTPPAQMAMKAALYIAMRNKKTTKSVLANKLNIDVREIRRMCDPYYGSKLPRMEEAIKSLGAEVIISLNTAA